MKNPVLDRIKSDTVRLLVGHYGYCGCADGDHIAMLNSGGEGENFTITIKDQGAIDADKVAKLNATLVTNPERPAA